MFTKLAQIWNRCKTILASRAEINKIYPSEFFYHKPFDFNTHPQMTYYA